MAPHVLEFDGIERAGLGEDGRVDVHLADIVEDSDQPQTGDVGFFDVEGASEEDGEVRDTMNVAMEVFDDMLHRSEEIVAVSILTGAHREIWGGGWEMWMIGASLVLSLESPKVMMRYGFIVIHRAVDPRDLSLRSPPGPFGPRVILSS